MTRIFNIKSLLAALSLTLLMSAQIFAQAGTGGITGVVADANGAVVPNATVKLENKARGTSLTSTSNGEGIYTFTLLQPGVYVVTVNAANFGENKKEVEVQVGRSTNANFELGASAVSEVVEVTAEGVQTTQSSSDAVLSETAIANLPINGRRFQDFATLTPTAQIDTERNQISLSGQRGINANINVDGTDYNQPFFGGIRGGERSNFAPTIPQESIKEFQVVAAGYNAEYGRSTGGIVNVVTKGGSNDFRGSLFALYRPDSLSRNHDFVRRLAEVNNLDIVAAPTQTQFGGSVGGPIVKNKLFYFGSIEKQGFKANRRVLFSGLDTVARTTANAQAFDYYRSQETPYELTNDAITALGRIDWNLNSVHTANFRFSWNKGEGLNAVSVGDVGTLFNPINNSALSNEGTEQDENKVFVSQLTSTFSANLFNEFRFQYARGDRPRFANALSPTVSVANVGTYGTRSFLPTTQFDKRVQFVDGLSVITGNHTMKFGGEFSDILVDQAFGFNQYGSYTFSGGTTGAMTALTIDPATANDRRFDANTFYTQQIGNTLAAFKIRELAFYGQDSWRLNQKLTINFGLRAEKQYNPDAELGNSTIIDAVKATQFPLLGGANFDPTKIKDSEWQIGPRFGFAWDMKGDGKSVVRGFAGIYYARTPAIIIAAPVNNFRIPAGDVSVQLPISTTTLSATTAAGVTAYNSFLAANPTYVSIMAATGTPCPAVALPTDTRACVPTTVFRQFAIVGVNANTSSLNSLPSLTTAQLSTIAQQLGFGNAPGTGGNFIAMADDFKNPRSLQFGVGYEREISNGVVIGFDYSQVNTTRLQRNRDINLPAPIFLDPSLDPVRRPYYGVSRGAGLPTSVALRSRPLSLVNRLILRESTAMSQFKAFTVKTRIVRKWANINASYTFSRSDSDDDNERNATGVLYDNTFDLRSEYGRARLDRPHQFVANPIFFLPGGFEVSSAMRFRSGVPVDAIVNSDLNGDTLFNDRPYMTTTDPYERNSFRQRSEVSIDVRAQKGFKLGESRRLIFSAELFNLMNNSNIQIAAAQTNFCSNSSDRSCGLAGASNPTFMALRDTSGNFLTSNFTRTPVFQMQLGARLQF